MCISVKTVCLIGSRETSHCPKYINMYKGHEVKLENLDVLGGNAAEMKGCLMIMIIMIYNGKK